MEFDERERVSHGQEECARPRYPPAGPLRRLHGAGNECHGTRADRQAEPDDCPGLHAGHHGSADQLMGVQDRQGLVVAPRPLHGRTRRR